MITVKVPQARLVQDPISFTDDVDPELVEIAKGLESFKGFHIDMEWSRHDT